MILSPTRILLCSFLAGLEPCGMAAVKTMSSRKSSTSTQDSSGILGLRKIPTPDGSYTDDELRDLRITLDKECLYRSRGIEAVPGRNAIPVEDVTKLALYLSGPLVQTIHPGSTLFRELQLKALISSLALLYYNEVFQLHSDSWNKLHNNLAKRFNDIVDQHSGHTDPNADPNLDRIRHFSSLYLIRLASMWAQQFGRSEPLLRSHISPVIQLIFAGYSIVGSSLLSSLYPLLIYHRP